MNLLSPWSRALFVFAVAAAAFAALARYCWHSAGINFLPTDRRADWILFPAALQSTTHFIVRLDATFRHEFTLPDRPRLAQLGARGAKDVQITINGAPVDMGPVQNWKAVATIEVQKFLRAGTNTIEARVFNDNGPPLLWLALEADEFRLRSDESWLASFAGSSWRNAVRASVARAPAPGNSIAGGEKTLSALAKVWPVWLLFAGIGAGALCWFQRRTSELSRRQSAILLLGLAGMWMILLWHNAAFLGENAGFDVQPHYDYIRYVQERRALPLPTEGYEMFQPPLYYVLSAAVLSWFRIATNDPAAVPVLRIFTMFCGIIHFTLVFLSLRLFFPQRIGTQLIGLLMAAFLPMQLYLSHYVTNETLAATLASATVYFALRLLKTDDAPMSIYAWLGLFMGAAILTKATGALLVPAVVTALLLKRTGFRKLMIPLAICLAVCGWHYFRIWRHFGTPLVGNWDIISGFAWWQDPGYHSAVDYFRFGRSLVHPLFSGFNGFWDGIYSTLWGDGLCGGTGEMALRPPWNYNFVVAGYILALIPTGLIMAGAIAALRRFLFQPSAEWTLLLGFSATVMLGVIFMTLKVASYAQIKAFYGLSMLVPLCFFVATGWELATRRRQAVSYALSLALLLWAANSFASYWTNDPASAHIVAGLRLHRAKQIDQSVTEAKKAVDVDPAHPTARRFLALILEEAGRIDQAVEETARDLQLRPFDSGVHLRLGQGLQEQGNPEPALVEVRRALELGPDNAMAYDLMFTCLRQLQRTPEAIAAAQDGLAVSPFNADLHYRLGLALAQQTNFAGAITHFAYAALLRPDRTEPKAKFHAVLDLLPQTPDAPRQLASAAATMPDSAMMLNELAWLRASHPNATLRNGAEALRLAVRASDLTHRRDPKILATLAAAYAESENFPAAITCAREASTLARSLGTAETVALTEKLLTVFQEKHPYRSDPNTP